MTMFRNIIWAVDPFESDSKPIQHTLKSIQSVADSKAIVHAIYANSRAALYFEKGESPSKSPFFKDAENGLKKIASQVTGFKTKTSVLIGKGGSDIDLLLSEAKKLKTELVVAAGHARGILMRMVLGSFTESLLLKSKFPVLIVNPTAKPSGKPVKRVLFPTDLGPDTHKSFKRLLQLAKTGGWHVTLLHVLSEPLVMVDVADPYSAPVFSPIDDPNSRSDQRHILIDWQAEARKAHITCTLKVPRKTSDPVKAVFNEASGDRYDLVVLSAEGKKNGLDLAGSRTRRIIRDSKLPVLVLKGRA